MRQDIEQGWRNSSKEYPMSLSEEASLADFRSVCAAPHVNLQELSTVIPLPLPPGARAGVLLLKCRTAKEVCGRSYFVPPALGSDLLIGDSAEGMNGRHNLTHQRKSPAPKDRKMSLRRAKFREPSPLLFPLSPNPWQSTSLSAPHRTICDPGVTGRAGDKPVALLCLLQAVPTLSL